MSVKYLRQALFLPQLKDEKTRVRRVKRLAQGCSVQSRVKPRFQARHSANRTHLLKSSADLTSSFPTNLGQVVSSVI